MTRRIEAIAYHGWGYDRTCWDTWKTALTAHPISFMAFDRGYFAEPATPQFSPEGFKLLLVHSYGLHLCPVEQLQMADLLVIFSSFLTFHPVEERAKRRSQRVLQRMVDGFAVHPEEVLQAFKMNSDDPAPSVAQPLNHSLLLQDLKDLGVSEVDLSAPSPRIMVFHGTDDRIVPLTQGQALRDRLMPKVQYVEIPEAGHALPFTHPQVCWEIVRDQVSALRDVQ